MCNAKKKVDAVPIKRKKKAMKEVTGLAPFMRKSLKGKKVLLQKKEALSIVKRAFQETFPDLGNFATMKMSRMGKKGNGEETLTFTIKKEITKADVFAVKPE